MIARIRSRLSYANLASSLALFLALSTGTVYAANEWRGSNIVDGSLTNADLKADTITSSRIKDNSLVAVDLGPGSVRASEIADGAVGTTEIASNAVTGAKVANNSLTTADLAGADISGGISVPTGYVPNGRCRQLDAAVGGAKAGEAVVFSVKAAVQDGVLLIGARVPSDGHITFNVCNFSGTTQAAINDLPVRIITFG